MFANFLIGLREGLEAALIVGILIAYLNRTERAQQVKRLWVGVTIAITVSLAFGAVLTWGPSTLTFQAQETLGGVLSLIAVAMVTWMVFWMAQHGPNLAKKLRGQLDSTADGSWFVLIFIGAISVGREGIETTLFLWANISGGTEPVLSTVIATLGIITALIIAWIISRGLVRINLNKFFRWTGLLLIIIAAGVFSYGFGDLQEASVIPGIGNPLYRLDQFIPAGSWLNATLGGMFNYNPEPTAIQVITWLAYITIVVPLFLLRINRSGSAASALTQTRTRKNSAGAATPGSSANLVKEGNTANSSLPIQTISAN